MNKPKKNEIAKEAGISTLKGLIGSIPFAGTAINEALFEARGRIKQNRVNNFIEGFSSFLDKYTEDELDLNQIKEEDFGDFFEELIIKISKTRSESKIKAFQNLLANQLIKPMDIDYAELFLEIISTLQEKQLPILFSLNKNFNSPYIEKKGELLEKEKELFGMEKDLKKEYWNLDSADDAMFVEEIKELEQNIKNLKLKIEGVKKVVKDNRSPYDHRTYKIEGPEFYYLIQDLVSKGLLMDLGMTYGAEPFDLVEITQLGMDLIESLTEKKPADNNGYNK